jgi:hypothetical protein
VQGVASYFAKASQDRGKSKEEQGRARKSKEEQGRARKSKEEQGRARKSKEEQGRAPYFAKAS